MDTNELATKVAAAVGEHVEKAVKMKLRAQDEGRGAKGAVDLATTIGVASLIIQCAQFALDLYREGKKASKADLDRKIEALQQGAAKQLDTTTKAKVVTGILTALP